VTDTTCAVNGR